MMARWGLLALFIGGIAPVAPAEHLEAPLAIVGITLHQPGQPPVEHATMLIVDGRIAAVGREVSIPAAADRLDATGLHAYPGFIDAAGLLGIPDQPRSEEERIAFEDENPDPFEGPLAATRQANRRGILPQWRAEDVYTPQPDDLTRHRQAGFSCMLATPRGGLFGGNCALFGLSDLPRRRATLRTDVAQFASFQTGEPGAYPRSALGVIAAIRQFLYDAGWYAGLAARRSDSLAPAERIPVDPALAAIQPVLAAAQPVLFKASSELEILRALAIADEFNLRIWIIGGREAWRVADLLKQRDIPVIASLALAEKPREPTYERAGARFYHEPARLREERLRLWHEQVDNVRVLIDAGVRVALSTQDVEDLKTFRKHLRLAIERGLDADTALDCLTRQPARLLGLEDVLGSLQAQALANVVLFDKPFEHEKSQVRYLFVEGHRFAFPADDQVKSAGDTDSNGAPDAATNGVSDLATNGPDVGTSGARPVDAAPSEPTWRIEIEADRIPALRTGGNVFIRDATVLPVSRPALPKASILVRDGRIAAVGADLAAPAGVTVIDGAGLFVMPGIIDCHSHMALGAINEGSLSITAEVRVADVVEHRQVEIYRALAGGVTTIHTMHGSSNTIGGECVVLKLRYGQRPDGLRFDAAPRTIKFALGENVTHKNRATESVRFPQSRMGVEAVLRQALTAAQEYREKRDRRRPADPPLRRDLRLETLAEVLAGDVWVHCHGYRADEFLRLIDVAESFGFRIAVLQHCLEGYRMLPEIARHGCGVSSFASNWAYKIEAYTGIPYNAAMLTRRGICTSVNSDSADTIRYLNLEAAKAVRWGGLSLDEALALITLNPARQLGIADRVGTIEVGKDADLAIFNGHPLDSFSRCVYTIIDGEIYFAHAQRRRTAPSQRVQPAPQTATPIQPSDNGVYLLTNAFVHPVSAEALPDTRVLIRDGRIADLGAGLAAPADATVIDLAGAHVWPGLIDAGTYLGLTEILAARPTRDENELGAITPELLALSAIHPHSEHIAIARSVGITTALTCPRGDMIYGASAVIDLAGWTTPEMLRVAEFAMHMEVPVLPPIFAGKEDKKQREEHDKQMRRLEDFLRMAQSYARWRAAPDVSRPPRDVRLEAVAPYLAGEKPVVFHAYTQQQILESLDFAEKHRLRPVIFGGCEAWKCADLLAQRRVPVIISTVTKHPGRPFEAFDSIYACAAELDRAGVAFCFATSSAANMLELPFEVSLAVAHGLPPDRAMRALTLGAAEILGIADQVGSLEPGKVANLIVTSDLPIQATAGVIQVFIRGVPMAMDNLHTRQRDRFAARTEPTLSPPRELAGPPALTRQQEQQP